MFNVAWCGVLLLQEQCSTPEQAFQLLRDPSIRAQWGQGKMPSEHKEHLTLAEVRSGVRRVCGIEWTLDEVKKLVGKYDSTIYLLRDGSFYFPDFQHFFHFGGKGRVPHRPGSAADEGGDSRAAPPRDLKSVMREGRKKLTELHAHSQQAEQEVAVPRHTDYQAYKHIQVR